MKLHFEIWIKKQKISSHTEELIDEAIICYRAKAFKAALLFSYLSFQNILRERVLDAGPPPSYSEEMWKSIQTELRNDDKWESKVIECVNRNSPGKIFKLTDDVKRQYLYWKDRRNDCAHGKGNKIDLSHVETFWLFFESNLLKFGVNGGKEALMEKINVFIDPTLTPSKEDPAPIINEVPFALETTDYDEFLDFLYKTIPSSRISFWIKLFEVEGQFNEYFINYLKDKKELIMDILAEDASNIHCFSEDSRFIRSLWKDMLGNSYLHYKIVFSLLRNHLVPDDQLEEFVETITSKISSGLFIVDFGESDLIVLEESGYFKKLKKLAFIDSKINNFDWARENRYLIYQYLLRFGFDEETVKAINHAFSSKDAFPWKLGDSIIELFNDHPQLREDFIKINQEHDGILPEVLFTDGQYNT